MSQSNRYSHSYSQHYSHCRSHTVTATVAVTPLKPLSQSALQPQPQSASLPHKDATSDKDGGGQANQFATNERLRVRAKETAAVRTKLEVQQPLAIGYAVIAVLGAAAADCVNVLVQDELEQVNVELALSIELQDKVQCLCTSGSS